MAVRVVIVDDSVTMRKLIAATLRAAPEIEVVAEAAEPHEAREMIRKFAPDVITLDIEMPGMDGLEFLSRIMRLRPTPVIMVSTLTQAGADINLRALEIGAFDCVAKPSSYAPGSFDTLAEKVKAAARSKRRLGAYADVPKPQRAQSFTPDGKLVAIGSSTGGVEALITILSKFPANCPPTIISQHMPAAFTRSFAARLHKLCAPIVREAADGDRLKPGYIFLAPGDSHLELTGTLSWQIRLSGAERVNGHRPSVDVMFHAVARHAGARAVGVILTGLGRDGAEGLLAMRQAGAETLGQDEASCIVYGMPKAAFELGAVVRQLPLNRIADRILAATTVTRREKAL